VSAREIGVPTVLPVQPIVPASEARGLPTLHANLGWALAGNVVYAISQWGMIVALAKFGNVLMVGQFSLGLAIVTPVLMFSNFDLRVVQATDARRQYRFIDYLCLRGGLTLAAIALIAAIVHFGRYDARTSAVILAVALAKSVETLSDIHYGLFQLNDRLDRTGQSMMLRGILSVGALAAGLYFTGNVLWGCLGIAAAWMIVLLAFDVRRGRGIVAQTEAGRLAVPAESPQRRRLLMLALPLGLVTTLAAVNLHMPRYFVEANLGERQLGIFSAMAYATISLTLVGDSIGSCVVPRLARLYAASRLAEYRARLFYLVSIGSAIGLFGLLLARGLGGWFLTAFYNRTYAVQAPVFTLLMTAAAIHFAASMLNCGITSARCFGIQVPIYAIVAGSTALSCAHWVKSMGLAGAALGVICGAVVRLLLCAVVVSQLLRAGRSWKTLKVPCQ
jgi:O-antigen/teichoic acid export membrane protein